MAIQTPLLIPDSPQPPPLSDELYVVPHRGRWSRLCNWLYHRTPPQLARISVAKGSWQAGRHVVIAGAIYRIVAVAQEGHA
jgi:hypothetical protein